MLDYYGSVMSFFSIKQNILQTRQAHSCTKSLPSTFRDLMEKWAHLNIN